MRFRPRPIPVLLTAFAAAFFAIPVMGGDILMGGSEGLEDEPDPTEGAEMQSQWNPTVSCPMTAPDDVFSLIFCLVDEISNPPPACDPRMNVSATPVGPVDVQQAPQPCYDYPNAREDFNTWPILPPEGWGVRILPLDDSEIERLIFRENDPGIQTTEVRIDRDARKAVIGEVEEEPAGGGHVVVTVNDLEVSVSTDDFPTSVEITAEIVRLLREQFTVLFLDQSMQVWAGPEEDGIRRVQFRSTDPGIISSDLSLLPEVPTPDQDDPRNDLEPRPPLL